MKIKNYKSGFSLFIAVIVMGALILIAFSVVNISIKETQFSTSNRESQYAIFAADAGIECALYWDSKYPDGAGGFRSAFDPASSGSPIICNGVTMTTGPAVPGTNPDVPTLVGGGDTNLTSIFGFSLTSATNPSAACVVVSVTKNTNGSTFIQSRGYNNCNESDPRRVERAIEVTY